jgi:hypothetical protein
MVAGIRLVAVTSARYEALRVYHEAKWLLCVMRRSQQ